MPTCWNPCKGPQKIVCSDVFLCELYNKLLAASNVPTYWKSSSLVPIFNDSGEPFDHSSYEPIRFLPLLINVLESLNTELVKHLN